MPLYVGGKRIAKIYKGSTPIARMYRGGVKVFDARALSLQYITTLSSTSNLTTYTFSSQTIGKPGLVIVAAGATEAATRQISSATIAGSAAAVNTTTPLDANGGTGIFSRFIDDDETGAITVTWNGGCLNCVAGIFVLRNYDSATPFGANSASVSGTDTSISTTLNTPAGGALVMIAHTQEDVSIGFNIGAINAQPNPEGVAYSIGSLFPTSEVTPQTVTASWTGNGGRRNISAASWAKAA